MSSSLAHDHGDALTNHGAAPVRAPRRRRLDDLPVSPALEVRPAFEDELPALAALLLEMVPGISTPFSTFARVHAYSRSIYTVKNGDDIAGCFACLQLNVEGLKKLLNYSLSMTEPERIYLAACGSPVDAIYAWAWAIRPPTNGIRAMGNLMAWFKQREFSKAEIYGRPLTDRGMGFGRNFGSRPVESGLNGQGLWVSTRFV